MATNKPQDDYQKQGVRIPRALHERIHEEAAIEGRSYNSQLIHIIQRHFDLIDAPGEISHEPFQKSVASMRDSHGGLSLSYDLDESKTKLVMLEGQAVEHDSSVLRLRQQVLDLQSLRLRSPKEMHAKIDEQIDEIRTTVVKLEANVKALRKLAGYLQQRVIVAAQRAEREAAPDTAIPTFLRNLSPSQPEQATQETPPKTARRTINSPTAEPTVKTPRKKLNNP